MSHDTCVSACVSVCARNVTETPRLLPGDRLDTEAKNSFGCITTSWRERGGEEARRGASDTMPHGRWLADTGAFVLHWTSLLPGKDIYTWLHRWPLQPLKEKHAHTQMQAAAAPYMSGMHELWRLVPNLLFLDWVNSGLCLRSPSSPWIVEGGWRRWRQGGGEGEEQAAGGGNRRRRWIIIRKQDCRSAEAHSCF